jgi:hypothetical protein
MILALVMVFMTAGIAIAGVGGSAVPTVDTHVEVGMSYTWAVTLDNQSTAPNNVNDTEIPSVIFTTTCGSSLTPAIDCQPGDQEADGTIDIAPLTALGVGGNCIGDTFTVFDIGINQYEIVPDSGVITLGPADGSGDPDTCEIEFGVLINALPVNDSSGSAGLQTSQLARASDMEDVVTEEHGAAAGSSTTTVAIHCLHVEKLCEDAASCEGSIGITVTAENCGTEGLENLSVIDSQAGALTCVATTLAQGESTTCIGSYSDVPGTYVDIITASADSVLSGDPVGPDAESILEATCDIPECPLVEVTKDCTAPTSCEDTDIPFTITVENTGPITLDECTITDPDCTGANGATTGPLAPGATADIPCTKSGVPGEDVSNTAMVTCSANEGNDTAMDTSNEAICSIPECPEVTITKDCEDSLSCDDITIPFSIVVENTGPVALTECTVSDPDCTDADGATTGPLAPGASSAPIDCTKDGTPGGNVANTASVTCTTAGPDTADDTSNEAICSIPACVTEICRTPGFWGTHGGTEKDNPHNPSQNITQAVIDEVGCLDICGEAVATTDVENAASALEAICTHPSGDLRLQLVRQLTAAALNCVISGGGSDCTGVSIGDTFQACNNLCTTGSDAGLTVQACIDQLDCFNNGGVLTTDTYCDEVSLDPGCSESSACEASVCSYDSYCCTNNWDDICVAEAQTDPACAAAYSCWYGVCTNDFDSMLCNTDADCAIDGEIPEGACQPNPDSCHMRELCNEDIGLCFEPPGPAGSSKACKEASKSDCGTIWPYEGDCTENDPNICLGAACAHDICVQGVALDDNCNSCVDEICDVDPYCCNVEWDGICVGEVSSVCGLSCP